jgi:hypothetical protein
MGQAIVAIFSPFHEAGHPSPGAVAQWPCRLETDRMRHYLPQKAGAQEADAMSASTSRAKPIPPAETTDGKGVIPPLQESDRLTRDEFERRYDAMPNLRKAELIEGVVYVPTPVRERHHSAPRFKLDGWLFNYRARTPGVRGSYNASVRIDL